MLQKATDDSRLFARVLFNSLSTSQGFNPMKNKNEKNSQNCDWSKSWNILSSEEKNKIGQKNKNKSCCDVGCCGWRRLFSLRFFFPGGKKPNFSRHETCFLPDTPDLLEKFIVKSVFKLWKKFYSFVGKFNLNRIKEKRVKWSFWARYAQNWFAGNLAF